MERQRVLANQLYFVCAMTMHMPAAQSDVHHRREQHAGSVNAKDGQMMGLRGVVSCATILGAHTRRQCESRGRVSARPLGR